MHIVQPYVMGSNGNDVLLCRRQATSVLPGPCTPTAAWAAMQARVAGRLCRELRLAAPCSMHRHALTAACGQHSTEVRQSQAGGAACTACSMAASAPSCSAPATTHGAHTALRHCHAHMPCGTSSGIGQLQTHRSCRQIIRASRRMGGSAGRWIGQPCQRACTPASAPGRTCSGTLARVGPLARRWRRCASGKHITR
jgi:hypothetical protein